MNSFTSYSIPSSTTTPATPSFWPWYHHHHHLSPFYPSPLATATIVIPEDKPLDLSAKSSPFHFPIPQPLILHSPPTRIPSTPTTAPPQPPQQQIRSSVIHSTKELYLPTCIQPEISIETPSPPNSINSKTPDPSPPNRMSYPREFKLMVIDYYYTNGLNKYRTCKEFQITKSMLNGWLAKADKIKQSKPGALKSGRSGRKPQFPDVEKQLYTIYLERVSEGEKISNRWIRETAKNIASGQNGTKDLNGMMCQFSERWLSNFKRRFGIGASEVGRIQSDNSTTASGDEGFHREDDEASCSSEEPPSDASMGSTAQMAKAVLHQSDEAPIQAFYKKFPWLCRRASNSHETSFHSDLPSIEEKHHHPQNRGRKVQFPMVEKQLYEVVLERQKMNSKEKITNKWLQERAREIAKKMGGGSEKEESKNAVFSEHWLNNFKRRFGLVPPPQIPDSSNSSKKMEE